MGRAEGLHASWDEAQKWEKLSWLVAQSLGVGTYGNLQALRQVYCVNRSARFVGRSGRDWNHRAVLGRFEDAKRWDQEMSEIKG